MSRNSWLGRVFAVLKAFAENAAPIAHARTTTRTMPSTRETRVPAAMTALLDTMPCAAVSPVPAAWSPSSERPGSIPAGPPSSVPS